MIRQLEKIGKVIPKSSCDIGFSRISLGFEKLDRDVFDPEKAYDKVAKIGVKLARIQSGWARTEKKKGVYDFEWIDKIVDNFLKRDIEPWVCLCYGNELYNEEAKNVFGAVGCAPIFTDEQKNGWENYVKAFVKHFENRINYYEVWNEPDGQWCWKPGPNAVELGMFTRDTGRYIKEIKPDAKVIGGVVCTRDLAYLNDALKTGMGDYIDFISFHEYTHDETSVFETVEAYRELAHFYNPSIEIIQGESGSQSRTGGHGAVCGMGWTEEIQAKQLARHMLCDLISGVHFTSYFSCMDMIEALNGAVDNTASYLDYGYFGVLGADFDENGKSVGTYYEKPSYYTLQNICSVFAEDFKLCKIPLMFCGGYSEFVGENRVVRKELITGAFEKENGKCFVYWYPSNILTTTVETVADMTFFTEYDKFKIIDIMDGTVYKIPDRMIENKGNGVYHIKDMPVKDTPLLLVMGEF